jgi:RNA polymerase sigma-70 factor (ECF subfamily)
MQTGASNGVAESEDAAPEICIYTDNEFKQALSDVAPHLRAFARSLCGCRDRADDLAQETMMRAWAARDRFHAGTNFKAWTFTILRNQFYSDARRNRFRGEYDEGVAERTLKAPAAQEDAIALSDVLRALTVLPATHREALILVAVGSLSYEEIADICGIALGTVKSRICRARAMLSNVLESGKLPDFRHNFVLKGQALDAFFAELARVANAQQQPEAIAA